MKRRSLVQIYLFPSSPDFLSAYYTLELGGKSIFPALILSILQTITAINMHGSILE